MQPSRGGCHCACPLPLHWRPAWRSWKVPAHPPRGPRSRPREEGWTSRGGLGSGMPRARNSLSSSSQHRQGEGSPLWGEDVSPGGARRPSVPCPEGEGGTHSVDHRVPAARGRGDPGSCRGCWRPVQPLGLGSVSGARATGGSPGRWVPVSRRQQLQAGSPLGRGPSQLWEPVPGWPSATGRGHERSCVTPRAGPKPPGRHSAPRGGPETNRRQESVTFSESRGHYAENLF